MKKIARISAITSAFAMIVGFVVMSPSAFAVNVINDSCSSGGTSELCKAKTDNIETKGTAKSVVNALLYILGIIAVIAIIIGGITYTTANGDASRVKKAKDIIMYAAIGLVVALMAWGIVGFVLNAF